MLKELSTSTSGYLTMRTSAKAPPSMVRWYCVLVGVHFRYYLNEDDANHMLSLKGEFMVSEGKVWDGVGNVHVYANAIQIVVDENCSYYAYADTDKEQLGWIMAIMSVLKMQTSPEAMAPYVSPLRRMDEEDVETEDFNSKCELCVVDDGKGNAMKCTCCRNRFCEVHGSKVIPLLHMNLYEAVRVCDGCYQGQRYVDFMRRITIGLESGLCIYPKRLDIENDIQLVPSIDTRSRGVICQSYDDGHVSLEELAELIRCDAIANRQRDNKLSEYELSLDEEIIKLHANFKRQSVAELVVVLHDHVEKHSLLFQPIVQRLLQMSYSHLDEIEFYWPQIIHAYLRIPLYTFDKMFWMDELVLSITKRSIELAIQVIWQLQGAMEDCSMMFVPKDMEDKYPRIVRLMVEVELQMIGYDLTLLSKRNVKSGGIPKFTLAQQQMIKELRNSFEKFKDNAPPPSGKNRNVSSSNLATIAQEPTTTPGMNAIDFDHHALDAPAKYKDFSPFQKHLLSPHDQHVLESDDSTERITYEIPSDVPMSPSKRLSATDQSILAGYFSNAWNFVQDITDIAEILRFVPVPGDRKKHLLRHLECLNVPEKAYFPLVKANGVFERIIRIPPNEATAFSTKARVPVMLIFEVLRGGKRGSHSSPCLSTDTTTSFDYDALANEPIVEESSPQVARIDSELDLQPEINIRVSDGVSKDDLRISTGSLSMRSSYNSPPSAPVTPARRVSSDAPSNELDFDQVLDEISKQDDSVVYMSQVELPEEAQKRQEERRKELDAAFGESWDSRKARIKANSPFGHYIGWDVVSMIAKSNDDLRQEVFALQIIRRFKEIFKSANLKLWLRPYRIISTSSSTGIIETLNNAISLDGLKKREGYVNLQQHFQKSYGSDTTPSYDTARLNLIYSMAAYSLVTYILQIKDRVRKSLYFF